MIEFAYLWMFLLLPLPWLVGKAFPLAGESAPKVRVPFGRRLEAAMVGLPLSRGGESRQKVVMHALVWLLLVAALARPRWIEPPVEKLVPTRDLLLLVDLSGSMQQEDFTNQQGKVVSRLAASKEIVGDFLENRKGDRVGLVVFGDSAFLQAPFSTDLSLTRELLDETRVGMAGPRTALGDAIGLGIRLFEESTAPAKTIIALTDGNDTKSQVPPVEASRVAADRGIRIHTVAIGDPTTAGEDKLDQQTLDEVAQATGGRSFFAANRDELLESYRVLDEIETREIRTLNHQPRRDVFHVLLAAALILSIASRLPLRRVGREVDVPAGMVSVDRTTGKLSLEPNP